MAPPFRPRLHPGGIPALHFGGHWCSFAIWRGEAWAELRRVWGEIRGEKNQWQPEIPASFAGKFGYK